MPPAYHMKRADLTAKYSWSVPTREAADKIADHLRGTAAIDYGSGSGYWAYLLAARGANVTCFDPHFVGKKWCMINPMLPDLSRIDSLILGWPPFGSRMALEILSKKRWRRVVYIGEVFHGCAEPAFFMSLFQWYTLDGVVNLPQWINRTDAVYLFS